MLVERIAEGAAEEVILEAMLQTRPTVAAVAGSIPAGGTGAAAGGWDTSGNRDTAITTITEIKTQLNALLVQLKAAKIIA